MQWILFGGAVVALLALDLLAHRGDRGQSAKAATIWTVVWIGAGLAFAAVILSLDGGGAAQDYLAAYLIEKSLSIDNLFVFLVIFSVLKIPTKRHHKVLFFGVIGALVFRAIFIFAGAAALERWSWVEYVFGAVLLFAAVRALREHPDRKDSKLVGWLSAHLPVSENVKGRDFFASEDGRWVVTPLLIALIGLELSDIVFAVDSVPAALSVTHLPFIVYSSNVFAILGLRSLYLVLAKVLQDLDYLHYGIAAVLAYTGVKMIIHAWIEIPSWISILVIVAIIAIAVAASIHARSASSSAPASTS